MNEGETGASLDFLTGFGIQNNLVCTIKASRQMPAASNTFKASCQLQAAICHL